MHGPSSSQVLAELVFPDAEHFISWAAPILVLGAIWCLIRRTDQIIHYLFPNLEWEKELGWLNIRAERRANAGVRLVGYGVYVVLIGALAGILWGAEGLQQLDNWSDPRVMGDLALCVPVLFFCLGLWMLYLGLWLVPKLRAHRDEAAFQKFRAEMKEAEKEEGAESNSPSRIHSPLRKPRTNPPMATVVPSRNRTRRKREPGE